jgi:hypothetical protein
MLGVNKKDGKWIYTYSPDQYERARKYCGTTPNGVVFHDELAGSHGADFYLLVTPENTEKQLKQAENYLRAQRDVASMNRAYPEDPNG